MKKMMTVPSERRASINKLVRSRLIETWVALVYASRCVGLDLFTRPGILEDHVLTYHYSRFLSALFNSARTCSLPPPRNLGKRVRLSKVP
jgi:hypothetical protein